jgi:hypothetical protein
MVRHCLYRGSDRRGLGLAGVLPAPALTIEASAPYRVLNAVEPARPGATGK